MIRNDSGTKSEGERDTRMRWQRVRSLGLAVAARRRQWGRQARALLWNPSSKVPLSDRLDAVCRSLSKACERAEPRFLEVGQGLQSVYAGVSSTTSRIQDALEEFGADSRQGVLGRIAELTESAFDRMKSCQQEIGKRLERVEAMEGSLEGLLRGCQEMERLALLLRMVSMNMGIESACCHGASDLFGVVSEDVNRLSGEITREVEVSHTELTNSRSIQGRARKEISMGLARLAALAGDAEATVEAAAGETRRIVELSLGILRDADRRSKAVTGQVGDVVVALQFHDNMNQRAQHVVEALEDAQTFFREGVDGHGCRPKEERLRRAHAIVRLQGAQVERMVEEILAVHGHQQKALDAIRVEVEGLGSGLRDLWKEDTNEEGVDPFHGLQHSLDDLKTLSGEGDALSRRMEASAGAASRTVVRVRECIAGIRAVTYRLRVISLNAIVKAGRLNGDGATLDVLSQEVQRLADSAGEYVIHMTDILQTLAFGAEALGDEGPGEKDEEVSPDVFADRCVREVTLAWQGFQAASREALDQSRELVRMLSGMEERLAFLPRLAELFQAQRKELDALETALASYAPGAEDLSNDSMSRLSDRYTMESERDTHKTALGGASSPVEDDSDDIPNEIWLPAQESDEGDAESGGGEKAESVELWDDGDGGDGGMGESGPSEGRLEPSESEETEPEDLGDNVELF